MKPKASKSLDCPDWDRFYPVGSNHHFPEPSLEDQQPNQPHKNKMTAKTRPAILRRPGELPRGTNLVKSLTPVSPQRDRLLSSLVESSSPGANTTPSCVRGREEQTGQVLCLDGWDNPTMGEDGELMTIDDGPSLARSMRPEEFLPKLYNSLVHRDAHGNMVPVQSHSSSRVRPESMAEREQKYAKLKREIYGDSYREDSDDSGQQNNRCAAATDTNVPVDTTVNGDLKPVDDLPDVSIAEVSKDIDNTIPLDETMLLAQELLTPIEPLYSNDDDCFISPKSLPPVAPPRQQQNTFPTNASPLPTTVSGTFDLKFKGFMQEVTGDHPTNQASLMRTQPSTNQATYYPHNGPTETTTMNIESNYPCDHDRHNELLLDTNLPRSHPPLAERHHSLNQPLFYPSSQQAGHNVHSLSNHSNLFGNANGHHQHHYHHKTPGCPPYHRTTDACYSSRPGSGSNELLASHFQNMTVPSNPAVRSAHNSNEFRDQATLVMPNSNDANMRPRTEPAALRQRSPLPSPQSQHSSTTAAQQQQVPPTINEMQGQEFDEHFPELC